MTSILTSDELLKRIIPDAFEKFSYAEYEVENMRKVCFETMKYMREFMIESHLDTLINDYEIAAEGLIQFPDFEERIREKLKYNIQTEIKQTT